MSRRGPWILALALLAVSLALWWRARDGEPALMSGADTAADEHASLAADFVGLSRCAQCHPNETEAWRGSHHDLAMQPATPETVLGDFDGASFEHFGVVSNFERRGDEFIVRTDGPDGRLTEYPIAYTFGVVPLQQYLVEFPGGRYQSLSLAWDSRPAAQGGERWFHLYPDERIPHRDVLHWTGPNQNWNFMCAECHSTDLQKRYLADEDRYDTTWFELDVACEACHGPGSAHVAWAEAADEAARARIPRKGFAADLVDHDEASWIFDADDGIARRTPARSTHAEIDACARCHARRSVLVEPYEYGRPFLETHRPALLDEGLYHADGQVLEEVYEYGSFLQSRMHHAGVTCSDCHDPHSLAIQGSADNVCARCHQPERFATRAHHHHDPDGAGSSCVACHMPETTYMVVDPRRDHSFRVPRPDLAERFAAPDACTGCHADEPRSFSVDAFRAWFPERTRVAHYGEALALAREGRRGATGVLANLARDEEQPGIVRATALALLRDSPGREAFDALRVGLASPDPIVRMGAATGADGLAGEERLALSRGALDDPVRAVRIEVARGLAGVPPARLSVEERALLERGLEEYRASQAANADRAGSHMNLGTLALELGDLAEAERAYQRAIAVDPAFGPSYVNLADLYRMTGRDEEGEVVLRRGMDAAPDDGHLRHALGLTLVRLQRKWEALEALELAWVLQPDEPDYGYTLAIARLDLGQVQEAIDAMRAVRARHRHHAPSLTLLARTLRERGESEEAAALESELGALEPAPPR